MRDILDIPRGNDFRLHICPRRIARAEKTATFNDIDGLAATVTRAYREIPCTYELTENGDIIVKVKAASLWQTVGEAVYGVAVSGQYNGDAWRWHDCSVFRIVECNPCSDVQAMESFSADTYFIYDDIVPTIKDDALDLDTHGHAWMEGGILHLMESENTSISIDNYKIIIKHGREDNKGGCHTRQPRQCCR